MTEGERIVGTSCFCRSRLEDMNDRGEIISIYLLPEYMGRGYGRALMNAAADTLHGMGFEPSGRYLDSNIGGRALREMQYCLKERL